MGFHPVNTQLTFQGGPSPDLWGSSLHVSPSPVLCPTKSSHLGLPNSNLSPHLGVATARIPHPKCSSKSASRNEFQGNQGLISSVSLLSGITVLLFGFWKKLLLTFCPVLWLLHWEVVQLLLPDAQKSSQRPYVPLALPG